MAAFRRRILAPPQLRLTRLGHGLAILALALVFTTGCGVRAFSDWDRGRDFRGYQTFTLEPSPPFERAPGSGTPFDSPLLSGRVESAVRQELMNAGFAAVPIDEEADFRVQFRLSAQERYKVSTTTGAYYGYNHPHYYATDHSYGWWGAPVVSQTTEAMLIIDFLDASSRELVWRGWAAQPLVGSGPSQERLDKVVAAILERFPPETD